MEKARSPQTITALDPNLLVSESGEFVSHILPFNSPLYDEASFEDWEWTLLNQVLSGDRLEELEAGAEPRPHELNLLIKRRVESALDDPDDDITPGLWFAFPKQSQRVAVVVCWGSGWDTRRELYGCFSTKEAALEAISLRFAFPRDFDLDTWANTHQT